MPPPTAELIAKLAGDVERIVLQKRAERQPIPLGIPGVSAVIATEPTPLTPTLYEPACCLILQGAKQLDVGPRRLRCGTGESVIVSHTVPLRSEITEASSTTPYIALIVELEIETLAGLADETDTPLDDAPAFALGVDTADADTVDAFRRLVALCEADDDAEVLAPLVLREIHYRLLGASHASMLHRLRRRRGPARRISRAIQSIRSDLTTPLVVPDLARGSGMSPSSFHEHFKTVTGTSPLQFQKDLRLLEARRLLAEADHNVTEASIAVGYRSPTQFSREYSRKFGVAPRNDRGRVPTAV